MPLFNFIPQNIIQVCDCLAGDAIGNAVYITGDSVNGVFQVASCDPTNRNKMPAVGIIISKPSSTKAEICFSGLVYASWTTFTPQTVYFVGTLGVLATSTTFGNMVQPIAVAISNSFLKVIEGLPIVHPQPTLASLSENGTYLNAPSHTATATGTNYDVSTIIYIDGYSATTTYISTTQVQFTVSTAVSSVQGTHVIAAVNPIPIGGTSSSINYFIGPGITSLSTSSVVQYEPQVTLTLTGNGFTASSVIWVNNVSFSTTFTNSTTISCTLPAAGLSGTIHDFAGTYPVKVIDPTGTSNIINYIVTSDADVHVWHRADQEVTFDGSNKVSDWGEIGPTNDTNKDLQQTVSARKPTYNATNASYNNKPTVTCGTGTGMPCKGTWVDSVASPFTAYVVGNSGSVTPGYAFATIATGPNAGPRNTVYSWTGTFWASYCDAGSTRLTTTSTSSAVSIVCAVTNGASSRVYVNNITTTGATGTHGSLSWTDHCVGSTSGQASNSLRGPLAEILLFKSDHDSTKRTRIMTYLSNRYGIAVSP